MEDTPEDGSLESYYKATRTKLGDNLVVLSREEWKDGYVDIIRTETSVAVSYAKRFYRAAGGRGVSLAFEGRDDVFWRIDAWADFIASTLQLAEADR